MKKLLNLLKKKIPEPALQSFEVGVRYMMYHGLALLVLPLLSLSETEWIERFFIVGTVLFSLSIFLLSLQTMLKRNLKILGPVTPLGGGILIIGWGLLLFKFLSFYFNARQLNQRYSEHTQWQPSFHSTT